MQNFISSIENNTKNVDVLTILNIKKYDKDIISTVTTTATAKSITTVSTTTQNNTNKSEYAFKKPLNSLLSLIEEGVKQAQKLSKEASEALSEKAYKLRLLSQQEQKPLLLQSINESEQQSGIVSDIILIVSNTLIIRRSTAISSIDCIAFVVTGDSQRGYRLTWTLAGQHVLNERRAEQETGYNTEVNKTDGNFTHFNHLIENMMNDNDTVNMICDSIDYLITVNTNHSIAINRCSSLICNDQNLVHKDNIGKAMANDANDANTSEKAKRTSKQITTYIKFDDLLRMLEWEKTVLKSGAKSRMRLCGGGEDSINNGTSVWGTPNANNPGNSWGGVNTQHPGAWGNNQQVPSASGAAANMKQQQQQSISAAGSGTPQGGNPIAENAEANAWAGANSVNPNNNGAQNQPNGANNTANSNSGANAVQQQQQQQQLVETPAVQPNPKLERLNTMIEALHALDGWGSENVNQDTRWDVPASPEPGSKPDPNSATSGPTAGIPMWKTNTGTEIWEANLRNGGQMPQQPTTQKTPWGPSTNIGGTWGEDDDANEPANVWTGPPGANQSVAPPPTNTANQQPPWNASNAGMWGPGGVAPGAIKKDSEWSGAPGPAGGGWDQRNTPSVNLPAPAAGIDPTNIEIRNMRITSGMDGNREIRGDPRGISGRLNGNVNLWEQHQLPGMAPNKIPQATTPNTPSGGGQWPNNPIAGHNNKMQSGWDDNSSQGVRRNTEEGTALWGQNTHSRQNSNVGPSWKDGPEGLQRNSAQRNSIVGGNLPGPSSRLGNNGPVKPDNLWGQNNVGGRGNSGWDENSGANWEDKNSGSLWNENATAGGNWNKNKQMGSNWNDPSADMNSEWGAYSSGGLNKTSDKLNQLEFIRSTKQYRLICDMGFKKEDVETVLRLTNMNLEESIEMLQRNASSGDWRRTDDHGAGFGNQFSGNRFSANSGNSSLPFPPNNQNLISGFGGNPNINSFNNMKFGAGHGGGPNGTTSGLFNQPSALNQNAQSQPSTQQLRMLVQQIQMAVQHGYLNHQILNQPLAPQTLLLLNQLLSHIKHLQIMQSNLNRSGGGAVNPVQISLGINKLKTQIGHLQNQITAQQAIYVKQQQQQNNPNTMSGGGGGHPGNDLFRTPNDLSGLPTNFSDMSLKDNGNPFPSSGGTSQQSRLNQWKLPSSSAVEKDSDLTDFPRAPGPTSKPLVGAGLGIDDNTWSNGRANIGDGWPDTNAHDKDWVANADAFTDLVPEFEPGKPWKGTQQTRIEDDPTITPGSVVRSPLSIAAKESNLFANANSNNNINNNNNTINRKSPPTEPINSSTWSFNASSTHGGGFSGSKLSKNPWPDSIVPPADLWDNSLSKGRVAPPGLKNSGAKLDVNGWNSSSHAGGWNNSGMSWSSSWILLKNITAQIDGSTLRTLCMQHGPLIAFHVYLNHGIALCKYSSREEANKAQLALNNCMLGNTTICAEIPTESDVQSIIQHLGPPSGSNGMTGGGGQSGGQNWRLGAAAQAPPVRAPAVDTWGSSWPSSGAGPNLWAPLDGPSDRGTPANLNSFLPESLLGTELN
ncbi:protein Gawky-like [Toxorhynchites rutilus septentrionalis]|uniref:protein Gawky-like n=1 Tax=Toxorhynchites rutilus septentrionalis TaxID=329112 RepID=UPI00247932BB|nr:protein Gawky-like [Toxorhynchites rutilus septentrionalis]XP_055644892.1 protein Gawky-like [Toxorhynchites rutilus septentrionalis]XP_055644894.1 protein Gawky-like [Toxorhynchites rutilus septentrionalis]XP_055644895.1 protein Gawky-like [Toxorhynchites rutilus septentrionalis]